jgi:hypothetical protein
MVRAGGLSALGVLLGARSAAAADEPCEPVRALAEPAASTEPWRRALEELVTATRRPGQPWSCPGGTVELALGPEGAALIVHDRQGRGVRRPVEAPSDLAPVGKALLAAPSLALSLREPPAPPPPPPVASPGPAPVAPPLDSAPPPPPPPRDPRILLNALVGSRVSGPSRVVWGSVRIAATVPIDRWGIGLWARYELPFAVEGPLPTEFSMDAADVGLSATRILYSSPSLALRATVDPALSLVMMESGDENVGDHPEGASVGFRLGAGLDALWTFGKIFRGVARLDGEVAPAGFGGAIRIAETLPAVPVYMIGVSLGAEAVIP